MATPCVLLTSCCPEFKAGELVRQILSADSLPSPVPLLESIVSYPWSIDTKYYTADVRLCTTESRTIGDAQFAESVEALVVYFDSSNIGSFEQVKMWLPYLKEISPPVQILVCDKFAPTDGGMTRTATISWGLDNGFEVVELNPVLSDSDNEEEEDGEEDQFKETTGVKRIVEALSCHSWSNMVLKDKPSFRSPYFQELMNNASQENKSSVAAARVENNSIEYDLTVEPSSSADLRQIPNNLEYSCANNASTVDTLNTSATLTANNGSREKKSSADIINGMIGEMAALGEDEDHDSFEKLFENLMTMKESAGEMSEEERKKYAEKVTLQFWKAVGGNPDEIDGLSDDDDDDDDDGIKYCLE